MMIKKIIIIKLIKSRTFVEHFLLSKDIELKFEAWLLVHVETGRVRNATEINIYRINSYSMNVNKAGNLCQI